MPCVRPGPFGTIDLSDPNGLGIRPLSRPSAAVRADVLLGLARCPASDAEHLASAQHVQDPGYRRLAGRVLILAEDEAAAAQGDGADDDHGQRQRLAGQGGRAGRRIGTPRVRRSP